MSGLFGGRKAAQSYTAPMEASLRVSTSAYGLVLPIVYGTTRVPGNLMWYGAFTAIPHTTTSSGGGGKGGGGGSSTTQTTYTYTASIMLGLSEGPIAGVGAVWRDKQYYASNTLFTIYAGSYAQSAWPYLTSNYPAQALAYRGVAYAAAANYDLGESSNTPNHSFEVRGIFSATSYNGNDVPPATILADYLTNGYYGAGFPASRLGNWTQYANYTLASGLGFSPAIDSAKPAHEFISGLMRLTNSGIYYSEGLLKITPYGDTAVTGNSTTYTPDLTPIYALTDDDYISDGGDPVRITRGATADAYNQIQLEFINRANQYNVEISEAKDQPNIEAFGLRALESIKAHEIADKSVARACAQIILQRSIYIRNQYAFRIGARFALLEPTDYVTITDAALGIDAKLVRILSIEEQDDYTYEMTAEDAPAGASSATTYPSQGSEGYASDYNVDPGDTTSLVVFAPPSIITNTGLEIWIAAAGGQYWGGCEVWASYDGTSYKRMGIVTNPGRIGMLTATLPVGADPDTTNTLAVNMTSHLALSSVTLADADNKVTLSYVGGELVSYQNVALTSVDHYNITYLRRGLYGTASASHASGAPFLRLDDAVLKIPFTSDKSGQTLYLKFPAYNIHGASLQDIAGLSAYAYTVPTITVTNDGDFLLGGTGSNISYNGTDVQMTGAIVTTDNIVPGSVTATKYAELSTDATVAGGATADVLADTLATGTSPVQLFYAFTAVVPALAVAGSITVNIKIGGTAVKTHTYAVTVAGGTFSASGIAYAASTPASCALAIECVSAIAAATTFKAVSASSTGTYFSAIAAKR